MLIRNTIVGLMHEGGPVLWGLLALAAMLFGIFTATWRGLRRARRRIEAGNWRGPSGAQADRQDIERAFAEFELDELAWVERRLPLLGVMTGAAPLLGLLGTVAGMLLTFGGLASAGQGDMADRVSAGISKALVTTQAGLIIAIPAVFLLAWLRWRTVSIHAELQRRLHADLARAAQRRETEVRG